MLPRWALKLPWNMIDERARKHGLDTALVGAFVWVESGGKSSATRYEPDWKYFLTPDLFARSLGITDATERVHQSTSWGFMQLMGSVARELGFNDNLPKLIAPAQNLEFGCMKLKSLITKYPNPTDAIAVYNAGSVRRTPEGLYVNQAYVDKITKCHFELS